MHAGEITCNYNFEIKRYTLGSLQQSSSLFCSILPHVLPCFNLFPTNSILSNSSPNVPLWKLDKGCYNVQLAYLYFPYFSMKFRIIDLVQLKMYSELKIIYFKRHDFCPSGGNNEKAPQLI